MYIIISEQVFYRIAQLSWSEGLVDEHNFRICGERLKHRPTLRKALEEFFRSYFKRVASDKISWRSVNNLFECFKIIFFREQLLHALFEERLKIIFIRALCACVSDWGVLIC